MPCLEEITYDLGRAELADQESLVSGIRARTGTLVATQALVASFLGGEAADLDWLAAIGSAHGYLCDKNYRTINIMSGLSALLSCVTVVQAFLWIGEIAA